MSSTAPRSTDPKKTGKAHRRPRDVRPEARRVVVKRIGGHRRVSGRARQATGIGGKGEPRGRANLAQGLMAVELGRVVSRINHRFGPATAFHLALPGLILSWRKTLSTEWECREPGKFDNIAAHMGGS